MVRTDQPARPRPPAVRSAESGRPKIAAAGARPSAHRTTRTGVRRAPATPRRQQARRANASTGIKYNPEGETEGETRHDPGRHRPREGERMCAIHSWGHTHNVIPGAPQREAVRCRPGTSFRDESPPRTRSRVCEAALRAASRPGRHGLGAGGRRVVKLTASPPTTVILRLDRRTRLRSAHRGGVRPRVAKWTEPRCALPNAVLRSSRRMTTVCLRRLAIS